MQLILKIGVMAGLVSGITEAAKRVGAPKESLPFIAMVIGVGMMYLTQFSPTHAELILYGLVIGLSSVGLFESGKQITKTVKGVDTKKE